MVVGMQVAAAKAGGFDAEQDLAGPRETRMRHAFDPQIARTMQARSQHGHGGNF